MARTAQYHLHQRTYASIAIGTLVLFALAAERASLRTLAGWEISLFRTIYNWSELLRPLFLAITQLGSAWMLLILPLAALAQKQKQLARHLLAGGLVTFLLMEWAKVLIDRPRPVHLEEGFMQREVFVSGSGFPSGHTAIATVLALTVLPYVPRRHWWLVILWPLSVGLSRIYLGVHAPLDVVGGLLLGMFVACLSQLWTRRQKRLLRALRAKSAAKRKVV